jgi:hypothetical protein
MDEEYSPESDTSETDITESKSKTTDTQPKNTKWPLYLLIVAVIVVFLIVGFFGLSKNPDSNSDLENQEALGEQNSTTQIQSNENTTSEETSNNNGTQNDSITGKTLIAYGKEVKQGIAIYNENNSEDCLYSIFFSCDVFESGCDENATVIGSFCDDNCVGTDGRPFGTGGFARLEDGGVVNAIQCSCSQCLSSPTGTKDFEFISTMTTCRKPSDKNGIEVKVENIGEADISNKDWAIHKIDGEEIDVWPFDIKVGESGYIFAAVKTYQYNFSIGEHTIELGLNGSEVKTTTVTCLF